MRTHTYLTKHRYSTVSPYSYCRAAWRHWVLHHVVLPLLRLLRQKSERQHRQLGNPLWRFRIRSSWQLHLDHSPWVRTFSFVDDSLPHDRVFYFHQIIRSRSTIILFLATFGFCYLFSCHNAPEECTSKRSVASKSTAACG